MTQKTADKPAAGGRGIFIFINVVVWVIILCFPFLLAMRDGSLVSLDRYVIYSWIPLMFMLVFYFNYYFLVDRLMLETRRRWLFMASNGVVIVVVATFSHLLQEFYLTRVVGAVEPRPRLDLATWIIRDGLVLMLVISLAVALKMVAAWQQQQREKERVEAERRDAELAGLRSQINPHFLFNSLNTIYALTPADAERAREAIHSLGAILRHVLYSDPDRVDLGREFDFLRGYVALMRLRSGEAMRVEVSLPENGDSIGGGVGGAGGAGGVGGLRIAPLLLVPLVENAFKHGVSDSGGAGSFVRIEGRIEGSTLTFVVANSDFPKADSDRSGSGIGLDNLRRRLALLYPGAHTLGMESAGGTHTARLVIEL